MKLYRKPTREDKFVNSNTSISKYTINYIIKMSGRESKIAVLIHTHLNSSHETNFITRLQKNIHNSNDRKFSIAKPKIRKLVSEMGVHI
jgi:hypothetical protein